MRARTVCLILSAVLAAPAIAFAGEVTIADLVADSAGHDASLVGEITVEGEMIGDFQRRGDWVWVQINGDSYVSDPLLAGGQFAGANTGVGVRIPTPMFDALGVSQPGGYRVRGPVVRLTGEWRHHDEGRGGESYLDVSAADLVSAETRLTEGIRWWAMLVGLALLLLAGSAMVIVKPGEGDQ